MSSRVTKFIAGGTIAGVAMAGSIAYASVPDSTGAIHACLAQQSSGTGGNGGSAGGGGAGGGSSTPGSYNVRVIDPSRTSCARGESDLTWNQTGPVGPRGPQGAQGAQGAQGPAGVAPTVYTSTQTAGVTISGDSTAPTTVFAVSVPPGTYMLVGRVQLSMQAAVDNNGTPHFPAVTCALDAPSDVDTSYTTSQGVLDQRAAVTLAAPASVGSGVLVKVKCYQDDPSARAKAARVSLSAIPIGGITNVPAS